MGELIPISDAPSLREGAAIVDTEGNELRAQRPAPEGYVRAEQMVEHRVRLTRREFADVAAGRYEPGRTPENGAPTVTVVDKRGANNHRARERQAEEQVRAQQREAMRDWTQQAAGTMFWEAQRVGGTDPKMAEAILAKRTELVAGARAKGILV